jgi:hypothetical protein
METKLMCFFDPAPFQFRLTYGSDVVPTSLGLDKDEMIDTYRLFLNHLHYRRTMGYAWDDGCLIYIAPKGHLILRTRTSYMTFDIGSAEAHSYVERVFYRFLQVAEETADAKIILNMGC